MGKRRVSTLGRTAVLALVVTAIACGTSFGNSFENPPEPPSPPGALASPSQIARYEEQHAEYQEKYDEYEQYWEEHERGYDDGRHRTCDAIEQVLGGSSLSRAKNRLDSYEDELPKETVHEQAYAKGFAEGRNFVNDAMDHDDATFFDLIVVCQ